MKIGGGHSWHFPEGREALVAGIGAGAASALVTCKNLMPLNSPRLPWHFMPILANELGCKGSVFCGVPFVERFQKEFGLKPTAAATLALVALPEGVILAEQSRSVYLFNSARPWAYETVKLSIQGSRSVHFCHYMIHSIVRWQTLVQGGEHWEASFNRTFASSPTLFSAICAGTMGGFMATWPCKAVQGLFPLSMEGKVEYPSRIRLQILFSRSGLRGVAREAFLRSPISAAQGAAVGLAFGLSNSFFCRRGEREWKRW